jgi:tRNA modification GTPase
VDIENLDTIAAIATPPGNGGVGIIRISGTLIPESPNNSLINPSYPAKRCTHHLL